MHWDDTFLRAFSHDTDHPAGEIDVIEIEPTEFRDPNPCCIEQLDDDLVSNGDRIVLVDRGIEHLGEFRMRHQCGKLR